jgi:hypothetical protein
MNWGEVKDIEGFQFNINTAPEMQFEGVITI